MMGHFHDVVGFAAYQEIDIPQFTKGIFVFEPGKCNDTHL